MTWKHTLLASLMGLSFAGAGCESVGDVNQGAPLDEAADLAQHDGELHYLPAENELVDGTATFQAKKPFRSVSSTITAAPDSTLEFQVKREDGSWGAWTTLASDHTDDVYRQGHLVLPEMATELRVRVSEGVEFGQFELFQSEEASHDDADIDPMADDGDGTAEQALSRPGAWAPNAQAHAAGQAQSVPYEGAPARCDTGFRVGTRSLGDYLRRHFPGIRSIGGFNCRKNTANPSQISIHGTGRAIDIMLPLHNGQADNDLGDPIAAFLMANANRIGITYIIWDRAQWTAGRAGNKIRPYTGPHPHHDHLHVELSTPGSRQQTAFFAQGMPAPSGIGAAATCRVGGDIAAKYNSVGGPRGFLGNCTTNELATPDGRGRFNHFQNGSIYWTPQTGAHIVFGDIRKKWEQMGWEKSALAYPTTDETKTPDGRGAFNHFEGGSIYWEKSLGAMFIRGPVRERWAQMGYERGGMGYPTSSEGTTPDGRGRFNHFQGGSIYWTETTGAHEVRGAIHERWTASGFERGPLGFPITNDTQVPGGFNNHFEKGSIYWSPATGARIVLGEFHAKYKALGFESGALQFPSSEQATHPSLGVPFQTFKGGALFQTTGGLRAVTGAFWAEYQKAANQNLLGLPLTDAANGGIGLEIEFVKGFMIQDPQTGAVRIELRNQG